VRVHVAFTPGEPLTGDVGVVVDVIRATSTIAQALASGYRRVLCCAEVDEARALAEREGDAVLGGERRAVRIEGFRFGNSPQELAGEPEAGTLVLTTTNGTRLLVAAAGRFETVLVGSILNLDAVAAAVRESGAEDVAVLCAGVGGEVVLDDAYCAGRIAERIGGEAADSAVAAIRLAGTFATPEEGLGSGQSARNLERAGLLDDVPYCARESALDVVPRLARMLDGAAEVTL
jgi:2-phosphosulfolactate phosphatase